nr:PREDICTED: TIMELESS-interacting protein isoform X2 [Latimeria chalumnae]|eukprot:XP_014340575.1 PREDICTED: TIMELESS-interacting protein isoform X2 [Latimeria chalumnae]
MIDPLENSLFDLPDYAHTEDEAFPPLPPPASPGTGEDDGEPLANGEELAETNVLSNMEDTPLAGKKVMKRPQPKLDAQRLISERGIPALRHMMDDVRFKGKGHEAEDLKTLMQHMEHWAHRLYPKLQFEDFIARLETLGNKKEVQTCLKRIRLDLPILHEDFIKEAEEANGGELNHTSEDMEPLLESERVTESISHLSTLTEEQQQRIERNRQLALEKRQARMQASQMQAANDLTVSQSAPQTMEESNTGKPQELDSLFDDLDMESLETVAKVSDVPCSEPTEGVQSELTEN